MAQAKEKKPEPKKQVASHRETKTTPVREPHEQSHQDYYYDHDVTELISWHAPGRPFKYRSREYFINSSLITGAVEVILFLFSQYLLMVVVLSLMFLSFALASVPPRSFYYKISTEGILIENNFFIWEELYDFYFLKINGVSVLHVRTKAFFPGELVITLGEVPVEEVQRILLAYLPFREHVEPGMMQKAGDWLERNFPLERNTPKSA
jgi:hypothetical protein